MCLVTFLKKSVTFDTYDFNVIVRSFFGGAQNVKNKMKKSHNFSAYLLTPVLKSAPLTSEIQNNISVAKNISM
jgi:hypothetical protein